MSALSSGFGRGLLAGCALLSLSAAFASSACAQATSAEYSIESQDLADALREFALHSGVDVAFDPEVVRRKRTAGVAGRRAPEDALRALLDGTGLTFRPTAGGFVIVRGPDASGDLAALDAPGLIVTGTRIRGAQAASPIVTFTDQDIRESGYNDLGEVVRSIPQNYSGGQNPGVVSAGGSINNQNIAGASSLNLRGLGPDATLTLLNGHRLSYGSFVQATDIAVIPVAALERIEILTDGASAVYGSDAVAGVANLILRRDLDGVIATAGWGTATDGGGEEIRFSLTGGTNWGSGGFLMAYDFSDGDAIFAHQRDYLDYTLDPYTIYPQIRRHSGLITFHQEIVPGVNFSVDGIFTDRLAVTMQRQANRFDVYRPNTQVFVVAPELSVSIGEWTANLSGSYGFDEIHRLNRRFTVDNVFVSESRQCYCNTSTAGQIDAEGPLFSLGGGAARLAVGAGFRENSYEDAATDGGVDSHYGFAELFLPFVSPSQEMSLVHRLQLTAAARYERYPGLGDVTTPKVGLVYDPTPDFGFKGTWGRSFKAPTLLQRYQDYYVFVWNVDQYSAEGYPANATVLERYGGNVGLGPEKAESWTATLEIHPRALPGFDLGISYFDIDYTDRVVQPVLNYLGALTNPAYAQFVFLDPSQATIDEALLAVETANFRNFSGAPYDPSTVVAVVDNRYTNVARQTARGVDVQARYTFDWLDGSGTLHGSASWLRGRQRNTPNEPDFQTAGIIYNPARFRARAGASWTGHGLTVASFVNHTGSVLDDQRAPAMETGSFTTVDLTLIYRLTESLELAFTALNLFDTSPPTLPPTSMTRVNYDSTNYSPIGRFVRFSLTARFW